MVNDPLEDLDIGIDCKLTEIAGIIRVLSLWAERTEAFGPGSGSLLHFLIMRIDVATPGPVLQAIGDIETLRFVHDCHR